MAIVSLRFFVATTILPTAWSWVANKSRSFGSVSPFPFFPGAINNRRDWGHLQSTSMPSSWTACPSCHGEGKIKRGPTKKQKLRHKRTKLENDDTPLPPRLEPCKQCSQTGLVQKSGSSDEASTSKYPRIAIIGGGLGGLALGIACSHRGIPFQIYERDSCFLQRKQGYGLTIQQASRALAAFGISTLKEGITSTRHVVHKIDGSQVGEWGLRKWGRDDKKKPPKRQNVHVARQSLRRELLDALGGEENVSWSHKLKGISEENGVIQLEFECDDGASAHHSADLVVGADGIRSTVRNHLVRPEGSTATPLRYLQCVVVLGICPLHNLEQATKEIDLLDGATVFQTADGSTRIYLMPYSSTSYMWQLSFPMEDEALAKDLSRRGATALKDEALTRCGAWHKPIPEILQQTPIDLVSGYPVYDRDLITNDVLNTGRPITLLGDAAHPMSPFKGQGANQALLDALSLARCIYTHPYKEDADDDVSTALSKYHEEMTSRSAKKVQASAQAAQFLHTEVAIQEGNVTRGAAAASAGPSSTGNTKVQ